MACTAPATQLYAHTTSADIDCVIMMGESKGCVCVLSEDILFYMSKLLFFKLTGVIF